jgi:hypothetical protein
VPYEHLDFLENGTVVPRSSMGDITIHTLELNRSDLVLARQRVAQDVSRQLAGTRLASNLVGEAASWLHRLEGSASRVEDSPVVLRRVARSLDGSQPYAAIARALLRRWLTEGRAEKSRTARPKQRPTGAKGMAAPQASAPPAYGSTAQDRTVAKQAQALRSRMVTHVAIHNFRGIHDLEVEIDYERGDGAPWTVLLGENATGKSSILQAIALTLLAGDGSGPAATLGKVFGWAFAIWGIGLYWWAGLLYAWQVRKLMADRDRRAPDLGGA